MPKRVALLGIFHETNTFLTAVPSNTEKFGKPLRGAEILEHYRSSNHVVAGYSDAAKELGWEIDPLMFASTGPSGIITADAYDALSTEALGLLQERGGWDGIVVCNHGAGVSEKHLDMEGAFCSAVRRVAGAGAVIGIAPDMHANISQTLVRHKSNCGLCIRHIDNLNVTMLCRRLML